MKGYWLVKNNIDKTIEICFPDNKMNLINALIATLNKLQLTELRDKLQQTTENTEPYIVTYEYGSLQISPENIAFSYTMFDNKSQYYLYTDVFRNALNEYIEEYDKMMNEEVGLSK